MSNVVMPIQQHIAASSKTSGPLRVIYSILSAPSQEKRLPSQLRQSFTLSLGTSPLLLGSNGPTCSPASQEKYALLLYRCPLSTQHPISTCLEAFLWRLCWLLSCFTCQESTKSSEDGLFPSSCLEFQALASPSFSCCGSRLERS